VCPGCPRAELFGRKNIVPHDLVFVIRIAEIATPGPNHNVQANGNRLAHSGNQPGTRSNPSVEKIAAEFNTMGATAFSRNRRLNRIDAHFENDVLAHDVDPFCTP
jgi:hypothetical protein